MIRYGAIANKEKTGEIKKVQWNLNMNHLARLKNKLKSSLSFGQAALTFGLPGITSCSSLFMTCLDLSHWASLIFRP